MKVELGHTVCFDVRKVEWEVGKHPNHARPVLYAWYTTHNGITWASGSTLTPDLAEEHGWDYLTAIVANLVQDLHDSGVEYVRAFN
jgi:hypothetical protein